VKFDKNLQPPMADCIFFKCLCAALVSRGVVSNKKLNIMRKEQDQSKKKKDFQQASILNQLTRLEIDFEHFIQSSKTKNSNYYFLLKTIETKTQMKSLRNQFEDLFEFSETKEALE